MTTSEMIQRTGDDKTSLVIAYLAGNGMGNMAVLVFEAWEKLRMCEPRPLVPEPSNN